MHNSVSPKTTNGVKAIRCGIYTRKSTEEGLDQEFNSLHAQREAGEAYITSQKEAGWKVLPDHYDDGGFSEATWSGRRCSACWLTLKPGESIASSTRWTASAGPFSISPV
jgi:hypothetical protein